MGATDIWIELFELLWGMSFCCVGAPIAATSGCCSGLGSVQGDDADLCAGRLPGSGEEGFACWLLPSTGLAGMSVGGFGNSTHACMAYKFRWSTMERP
jgi:hypothetical protein